MICNNNCRKCNHFIRNTIECGYGKKLMVIEFDFETYMNNLPNIKFAKYDNDDGYHFDDYDDTSSMYILRKKEPFYIDIGKIKKKKNIIEDLKKLLNNDFITKSDIKAIISKHNGLEEYLSSIYKLAYYNNKVGFGIELSTSEPNELDVNELQSKIKKRFGRDFIVKNVSVYDSLNQVVIYCEFCD